MEVDMLVAAMTGDVEDENGFSEKILELSWYRPQLLIHRK